MKKANGVFRNVEVTYIYGQTGTGKTKYVMEKCGSENCFRVTNNNHRAFDGYKGQDVIVFEEFRSRFRIEDMLNYLDGYPLMLPSRWKNKEAAYTKVYILTDWPLEKQYEHIQTAKPEVWNAFLRRIHHVFNFDENKEKKLKEDLNGCFLF